jgi:predicted small lipoprotein YifL
MKSSTRLFGLALLLFSLVGCGLKGPLYLPDDKAKQVPATGSQPALPGSKVRTLPPAPQSQKKDRDRTDPSTPNQSQPTPVSPPDPNPPATTPPPQAGQ